MCRALLVRHALCDPVGRSIAGWQAGIALNDHLLRLQVDPASVSEVALDGAVPVLVTLNATC